jgi:hypothetical protein
MKLANALLNLLLLSTILATAFGDSTNHSLANSPSPGSQNDKPAEDKFIYADFERIENGRPVSNGGGLVQIYTAQESTPVQFKGIAKASPGAPEIVTLKDNNRNHLATFEYSLTGPNQWANVTLEVQGRPYKDGKAVADDVSAYKNLSVQLYATGVDYLRVEFVSHGQGINLAAGFPQLPIKIRPGLNTYLIPLKGLLQPSWVQDRVDAKVVLKKLTAISISAYCNQCTPQHGMVLVDNLVFQK